MFFNKKEKETIKKLEEEKNMLKVTLELYAKENQDLKQNIRDMKVTVKANKDQLDEYISTITNKDMAVEKMKNTISQLRNRIDTMEDRMKKGGGGLTIGGSEMKSDPTRENTGGIKNKKEVEVQIQVQQSNLNVTNFKNSYEKLIIQKNKLVSQLDSLKKDIETINNSLNLLKEQNNQVRFLI